LKPFNLEDAMVRPEPGCGVSGRRAGGAAFGTGARHRDRGGRRKSATLVTGHDDRLFPDAGKSVIRLSRRVGGPGATGDLERAGFADVRGSGVPRGPVVAG
jgi:hypothetical protein